MLPPVGRRRAQEPGGRRRGKTSRGTLWLLVAARISAWPRGGISGTPAGERDRARMAAIYTRLEVRPIINARGTHTRLGGSLMAPAVLDAMREAASAYVVLDELQEAASEIIARATGAEAGLVTGGAAAGLLLGTAACLAGE